MICFWSSASWPASCAFWPPSWPSFSAEPADGCSPWRKISSKGRTSAKNMSLEARRTLAVRADVLGPEEVGHELVGHGLHGLEVEHVLGVERSGRLARPGWPGGFGASKTISFGSSPPDGVAQPVAHQPEVVVHLGLELELLERRDLDIVRRLGDRDGRGPVPRDVDDDLWLDRVGAPLGVDQLDACNRLGSASIIRVQ